MKNKLFLAVILGLACGLTLLSCGGMDKGIVGKWGDNPMFIFTDYEFTSDGKIKYDEVDNSTSPPTVVSIVNEYKTKGNILIEYLPGGEEIVRSFRYLLKDDGEILFLHYPIPFLYSALHKK
jgi:hypothetical protein